MKPVYETRRPNNRWLMLVVVVAGLVIFAGLFVVRRAVLAQPASKGLRPAPRTDDAPFNTREPVRELPVEKGSAAKPNWEFRIVVGANERLLNQAAAEGFAWVETVAQPADGSIVTILKRRKPADAKGAVLNSQAIAPISGVISDLAQESQPRDLGRVLLEESALANNPAAGQKPGAVAATTWEYLTIAQPSDARLAEAGKQGWELVCVTAPSESGGHVGAAFLKRPLHAATKLSDKPSERPTEELLPPTINPQ